MAPKKLSFKKRLKEHFDIEVISIMALEIHTVIESLPKRRDDFSTREKYDTYVMRKLRPVIRKYCHGKA